MSRWTVKGWNGIFPQPHPSCHPGDNTRANGTFKVFPESGHNICPQLDFSAGRKRTNPARGTPAVGGQAQRYPLKSAAHRDKSREWESLKQ